MLLAKPGTLEYLPKSRIRAETIDLYISFQRGQLHVLTFATLSKPFKRAIVVAHPCIYNGDVVRWDIGAFSIALSTR